ncbi:hypothetical protein N7486_007211 [Penicillium sp. IBT 16267x]|nr:hypothetical protein N7486_007211 [Penicillium sp. IBT 16267x]
MYSHLEYPGSTVTAVHCKAQEDLPIVDRLLEPQTIANFLSFALGQPLPNGTQPDASIIRLTTDELPQLQANFPPNSTGKSIIDRVASRIGSEEDNARLCLVGKNIHSLKSRLWEGIVPLSDTRWKEKKLDEAGNFEYACHHLTSVVAVFEYLNTPIVRKHLRDTFNLIYDHWASADTLLNVGRVQNGLPRVSVAGLWTLYMSIHLEVMTQRAHSWVSGHVDMLRAPQLQGLRDHRVLLGSTAPDRLQWRFMDNLHVLLEVSVKADVLIMIPMEGYKGYAELYPERRGAAAALGELGVGDCERRGKAYAARLKARSHQIMHDNAMPWNDDGSGQPERSSGEGYRQLAVDQVEAQDEVREKMRGVPGPLPREPWISSCLAARENAPADKNFEYGLTIYRLTYGQSEAEWTEFVQKLEAHISNWGDGQTGCHLLKPHLKLCWVDGKENDIAEGDIEAAKRHFNKANEGCGDNGSLRMQNQVFVAIDSASFASYTTKSYRAATSLVLAGDFSGFVLAVDPDFDLKEGISRPDESPGYTGQMRILGSLIWGDLYALHKSQSALLEDLWPLAMNHPNQVYVGPTTPLQVYIWRKQNAARWIILREVVEYAKRKMGMTTSSASGSGSGSGSTPGDTSSSATASTEAPQPAPRSQTAENLVPRPVSELDPINEGLHHFMLRDFQRFLRRRGANREAVMVDEMLDTPPGATIDVARLGQRINADLERRQRQQRDGIDPDDENETDGGPPECPPQ